MDVDEIFAIIDRSARARATRFVRRACVAVHAASTRHSPQTVRQRLLAGASSRVSAMRRCAARLVTSPTRSIFPRRRSALKKANGNEAKALEILRSEQAPVVVSFDEVGAARRQLAVVGNVFFKHARARATPTSRSGARTRQLLEAEERLTKMGFKSDVVRGALRSAKGNEQAALEILLSDHTASAMPSSAMPARPLQRAPSSSAASSSPTLKGASNVVVLRRPGQGPIDDVSAFKHKCPSCSNAYETAHHLEKHQRLRHALSASAPAVPPQSASPPPPSAPAMTAGFLRR